MVSEAVIQRRAFGGGKVEKSDDDRVPGPVRQPLPDIRFGDLDLHPRLLGQAPGFEQPLGRVVNRRHGVALLGEVDGVSSLARPQSKHLLGSRKPPFGRLHYEGVRPRAVDVLHVGEPVVPEVG